MTGEIVRTKVHDQAIRSWGSVVASLVVAAAVCALPLIPAVHAELRVEWYEVTLAMSVFAVLMITGAIFMPRYGRYSRFGETFDSIETVCIQGAVLWLVFASGRGDSFFWVLWMTHAMLVGNTGAKFRFTVTAFGVSALLLALAFLVLERDAGSAALSVVIGTLGCYINWVAFAAADRLAIADAERARLAAELAESRVVAERQRIARDIHDGLGTDLAAIDWRLRGLRGGAEITSEVDELVARLGQGTNDLRAIVWALRTPERTWTEIVEYVRSRAQDLCSARLALVFEAEGEGARNLSGELALDYLRAVLELIHNAVRHSRATQLAVRLRSTGDAVSADLEDDGRGIPPEALARDEGGLANLRARVANVRGELRVEPAAPHGTRTSLTLRGA